jgi:hypothetical protein
MKHYRIKINSAEYKIVLQLYHLKKAETKKEARLPLNDFRKTSVKHKTVETTMFLKRVQFQSVSLKNFLTKVAALW